MPKAAKNGVSQVAPGQTIPPTDPAGDAQLSPIHNLRHTRTRVSKISFRGDSSVARPAHCLSLCSCRTQMCQVRIATTICSPLFFVLIASIITATAAEVAISVPAACRHAAIRRTSIDRLSTYEKSNVPMPHRQAIEASSPCPVPMQNATRNWARILGVPIVAAASCRRCCGWKPQPRTHQAFHRMRGALIDVTPLSDGDGAIPSSRDPSSANRERTTSILTGLTRWSSMPASFDRRRSSGCP
jgi:hypothetical protein